MWWLFISASLVTKYLGFSKNESALHEILRIVKDSVT